MPTTDSTPTALTISAPPPRQAPDPTAPITPLDPPGILAQLLDPESFETLHAVAAQHKLTLKELADRLEDDLDTLRRLVHVAHLRTAFMAAHAEHIALAALTQIAMVPLEDTSPRRLETVRRASTTITTISKRWTPILYNDDTNPPPPSSPQPPASPDPPPTLGTPPRSSLSPSSQPDEGVPAPSAHGPAPVPAPPEPPNPAPQQHADRPDPAREQRDGNPRRAEHPERKPDARPLPRPRHAEPPHEPHNLPDNPDHNPRPHNPEPCPQHPRNQRPDRQRRPERLNDPRLREPRPPARQRDRDHHRRHNPDHPQRPDPSHIHPPHAHPPHPPSLTPAPP